MSCRTAPASHRWPCLWSCGSEVLSRFERRALLISRHCTSGHRRFCLTRYDWTGSTSSLTDRTSLASLNTLVCGTNFSLELESRALPNRCPSSQPHGTWTGLCHHRFFESERIIVTLRDPLGIHQHVGLLFLNRLFLLAHYQVSHLSRQTGVVLIWVRNSQSHHHYRAPPALNRSESTSISLATLYIYYFLILLNMIEFSN